MEVIPDLLVEILSKDDTVAEIYHEIEDWLKVGGNSGTPHLHRGKP